MPAVKKAAAQKPAAKKTPSKTDAAAPVDAKKYGPAQLPWVVAVLNQALSQSEYETVGLIATAYSQFQAAKVQGKDALAARRHFHLRELATLHVTKFVDEKYRKKRDALLADSAAKGTAREDLNAALDKARASAARARAKAIAAAGFVPTK